MDQTVDYLFVNAILNQDGVSAQDTTPYNLNAMEDWATFGAECQATLDAISTITVSNYVAPTISKVGYDFSTGTLTVTGVKFVGVFCKVQMMTLMQQN